MWKYSAYITKEDGQRVYAKWYGKKAFRFWVDETNENNPDVTDNTLEKIDN